MPLHIVPACREVIQPAPCSSAAQRDDGFMSIRFGLCQRLKHFRYPWSDIHSYDGSRVISFIAIRPFESCFLRYLNQRRLYFSKQALQGASPLASPPVVRHAGFSEYGYLSRSGSRSRTGRRCSQCSLHYEDLKRQPPSRQTSACLKPGVTDLCC